MAFNSQSQAGELTTQSVQWSGRCGFQRGCRCTCLPAIKGAEQSWFPLLISFCHASFCDKYCLKFSSTAEGRGGPQSRGYRAKFWWALSRSLRVIVLWCYTCPSSSSGLQSIRKAEIYGASTVYYLTNPCLLPCGLVCIKFINAQKWEPSVSVHSSTCLSFLCCITLVTYSVSAPPVMATTHCIWIQPLLEICPSVKLKSAL